MNDVRGTSAWGDPTGGADVAGAATPAACERCGQPLRPGELACPRCGALVHRGRLEQLSGEALRAEQIDPMLAARIWQQCLPLLPPNSQQFEAIAARIRALTAGLFQSQPADSPGGGPPVLDYRPAQSDAPSETWQSILFKTGGSMALSVALYAQMGGWAFAVGLVLLIFVHEMGHVVANWHYGIRQSAPIFMGIFGAVIFVRGRIRNAKEEAVMGIAGPVFGSVPALACYAWFLKTGDPLAGELALYGIFINAFNLIPMPPLDGGRTAAAITPWLWVLGAAALLGFEGLQMWASVRSGRGVSLLWVFILLWILSQTLPRLREALLGGGWRSAYYRIGWRPRVAITAVYVGLGIVLFACLGHLAALKAIGL